MTTIAITGGHIVPIEGTPFNGTVVITDGLIEALGPDLQVPPDAEVIDATLAAARDAFAALAAA